MSEPVLDLSEIVGMYKEDARRSVERMRASVQRWKEVGENGPAGQELRKLAHQLRGSGRTYGFRNVTRIGKALEHLMIKLQAKRLAADDRLQKIMASHIERLADIFKS
jgi:chemotaxis protein histidine kinase CheA